MNIQRRKLAVALAWALGSAGGLLLAQVAGAADVRVMVTGSNLPRVEGEGALPVQVITREDMERAGVQSTMALIERLSVNSSIGGLNLSGGEGATLVGYQSASLRGLGGSRTLVLLNGRRLANTAFSGTTVDINSIPLSAVERVEVLTDGASAIYGTDAIAGVVNFILRRDFTGVEAFAYYGDTQQGGGESKRYNLSGGWGDLARDRWNVFGTVDYQKNEEIRANQREYSKTAYLPFAPGGVFDKTSGNSIPGNVLLPGVPGRGATTQNPAYPGCLPPFSFGTLTAATAGQCRFDYASVIDIVPPSEQWNVFGKGTFRINPSHELFLEGAWSRSENIARVSPPPISSATILSGDPVLTMPGTPFYPTALATRFGVNGQPLEVFWRGLELGPRTDKNTIEQTRVVGGLQGTIAGWDYTAAINWSESKAETEWQAGWALGSALLPILNSGQINLFGLNSPEAVALMRQTLILGKVLEATGTSTEFDARVSRELWQMPAGPLGLAVGTTYRKEEYELISSDATRNADVPGLGGSISTVPSVERDVWAVYGEVNIPLLRSLEANVAVRYDDYENIGSTTNPKVSLRWQPTRQVLVRASAGKGFRAPSLIELHQPNLFGATGDTYDDPLRCPFTGSPRDCNAQFTTQLGGNPDLKPERSKQWSAGVLFEPSRLFTIGADYWNIEIKDVIGIPGEFAIFSDMVASEAAGLLFRYAPGSVGCPPQPAGVPCPVNFGIQNNFNLNKIKTSGVDVNATLRTPTGWGGSLSLQFQGSYLYKWNQQEEGRATQHLAGTYAGGVASTVVGSGSTGAFPRWKHTALLTYVLGPWQASVNQIFVSGYNEPTDDAERRVGAWETWGVNGAYTGFRNLTLTLGVKNVFNRDPPYTRQAQAFQIGYDPAIADPAGRFFYGSIRYAFR